MKIALLFVCIALAACGAKSHEEKAKDLIAASLKSSLPDFNSYESIGYTHIGIASQPFEETDQYKEVVKKLRAYGDSVALLEKMIKENNATGEKTYKNKLQLLQDSTQAINERKSAAKQAYSPEKLFKLTHTYKFKNKAGEEIKTEEAFYFDENMTKIVKINHLN